MWQAILIAMGLVWSLLPVGQARTQSPVCTKIQMLAHQNIAAVCEACEVSVECKWISERVANLDSASVRKLQFDSPGVPRGYKTAHIAYSQGDVVQRAPVQLLVRLRRALPVAVRRIERGQIIGAEDLQRQSVEVTGLNHPPVSSADQLKGKAAARLIRKGSVIYEADVQEEPLVEPGDNMLMVYLSGGVEVAVNCRAREAKAEGERIRLYCKETGKTYFAKVLTSSKAIWEKTL